MYCERGAARAELRGGVVRHLRSIFVSVLCFLFSLVRFLRQILHPRAAARSVGDRQGEPPRNDLALCSPRRAWMEFSVGGPKWESIAASEERREKELKAAESIIWATSHTEVEEAAIEEAMATVAAREAEAAPAVDVRAIWSENANAWVQNESASAAAAAALPLPTEAIPAVTVAAVAATAATKWRRRERHRQAQLQLYLDRAASL